MGTFAKDIEDAAGDEPIIAIVIAPFSTWDEGKEGRRDRGVPLNRQVSWQKARPHLDYEYDTGFGGADCHAIYAWTSTRVLFVHEYDGSTCVVSVPRNPVDCAPAMSGE